jgi:hypothetical protein
MRNRIFSFVIVFAVVNLVRADVLKLKQGGGVQGVLVSANSQQVSFMGVDGTEKEYPTSAVRGIEFAPLPPPPAPKPKAAAASAVIPAGTQISVRMIDSISGKTAAASQRYRASVDDPVVVGDRVLIPRGADCTVQVVEVEGGKGLDVKLYDVTIGGKPHAASTDYATVAAEGTSKTKKAVRRGVGLGAIGAGIGALAGGGSGAAIGAAVGGGAGAISAAASKGKQIELPSESRLSFTLRSALPVE